MTRNPPLHAVLAITAAILSIASATPLHGQASTMGEKDACAYCQPCPLNRHALVSEAGDDVIGQSHDCVAPGCPGPHSTCPGSFAGSETAVELEVHLAKLAAADSPEDVVSLMGVLGDQVILNVERSALQVLGCSGEVIGQIPMRPEITSGLRGHVRTES